MMRKPMTLLLSILFVAGKCQAAQTTSENDTKIAANTGTAIALRATSTVNGCITVEAGLLPQEPAAKLFGGWVAQNYAVVETTVANHCDNEQFIVHNIYLDYSDWALSGVYKGLTPTDLEVCPPTTQAAAAPSKSAQANPSTDPATTVPSSKTGTSSAPSPLVDPCEYTQSTRGGRVPTIGARVVHDQSSEASIFSPRNLVVNGLVLVGEVAGGYAFAGSAAAVQGIGAYNSAFIPGLQKFWPDRRPQQETNVLTYGYRTDQSTAVAKDDHGSYFAFFPISSFLIRKELKPLFLSDPAAFINPGEVLLDISGDHSGDSGTTKTSKSKKEGGYVGLRNYLLDLAAAANEEAPPEGDEARRKFSFRLQSELGSPCNLSKDSSGAWKDPGPQCPLDPTKDFEKLKHIATEKFLFAHASLNIVKIVVKGVMTVEVDTIPPTIDTVTFDGTSDQASYWTVTQPGAAKPAAAGGAAADAGANPAAPAAAPSAAAHAAPPAGTKGAGKKPAAAPAANAQAEAPAADAAATPAAPAAPAANANASGAGCDAAAGSTSAPAPAADKSAPTPKDLTGVIAGKYLTDSTPAITAITVPGDAKATPDCYIVPKSMQAVPAKSTDSSLPFKLQLSKTLPSGSKITFQVSRSTGDASTGTSSQTTSNKFDYTVTYAGTASPAAAPTVTKVKMDNDDKTDVWQTPGKLNGTATGTGLDGGTIKVSALQIGGKNATVADYIGPLVEVPKSSSATSLDFQLPLLQKIADGSTVTFEVTKTVDGTTQTSNALAYPVKNPAAAVKKKPAPVKKPVPKPAATSK
jgi:hypothetical protein